MTDRFVVFFAIKIAFWFIALSYSQVQSCNTNNASEFNYYWSVNSSPQEAFVEDPRYEQYVRQQYRTTDRVSNNDDGSKDDYPVQASDPLHDQSEKLRILVTGGAGFIGKST